MLSRMRGMRRCPEKALAGQGRKRASRCRVDSCTARRQCSAERSQTKRTSRWTVSPRALGVRPSRPSLDLDHDIARAREPNLSRRRRPVGGRRKQRARGYGGVPSSRRRTRSKRPDTHVRLVVERLPLDHADVEHTGRQLDWTVLQLAASSSDDTGSPTDTARDSSTRPVDAAIVLFDGGLAVEVAGCTVSSGGTRRARAAGSPNSSVTRRRSDLRSFVVSAAHSWADGRRIAALRGHRR